MTSSSSGRRERSGGRRREPEAEDGSGEAPTPSPSPEHGGGRAERGRAVEEGAERVGGQAVLRGEQPESLEHPPARHERLTIPTGRREQADRGRLASDAHGVRGEQVVEPEATEPAHPCGRHRLLGEPAGWARTAPGSRRSGRRAGSAGRRDRGEASATARRGRRHRRRGRRSPAGQGGKTSDSWTVRRDVQTAVVARWPRRSGRRGRLPGTGRGRCGPRAVWRRSSAAARARSVGSDGVAAASGTSQPTMESASGGAGSKCSEMPSARAHRRALSIGRPEREVKVAAGRVADRQCALGRPPDADPTSARAA